MINKLLLAGTALVSVAVLASPASAQIALGDTLQLDYLFPDTSSVYDSQSTVFTGAGTTLPVIYTGTATFDSNLISIVQNDAWNYSSAPFNGVRITDLSNLSAFNGWNLLPSTTMTGFSFSSVGGSMYVNWQSVSTFAGAKVDLGGAVPEPASWAMMLRGVGLVGGAMRSRRRQAVSFA